MLRTKLAGSSRLEKLSMEFYFNSANDIIPQSLRKIDRFIFKDIFTDDPDKLASFLKKFLEDIILLPEVLLDIQKKSPRNYEYLSYPANQR